MRLKGNGLKRQNTIERLDSFEQEQRKAKPFLGWEMRLLLPIPVLYVLARIYMIVEVFLSLRRVPVNTYKTFDLAQLLPHL